jgi:hypothetical protein
LLGALTPAINVLAELRRFLGREDRGLPQIDRGDELHLPSTLLGWRSLNGPHLVALMRAGVKFDKGVMVERPNNVQEVAA